MTTRRQLLKALAVLPAAGSIPVALRPAPAQAAPSGDGSQAMAWRNWSGLQVAHPRHRAAPKDKDELRTLITKSQGVIRPIGAGHSFTPLMNTDETLVSLDRMQGLLDYDNRTQQATVAGGTRLFNLGRELEEIGQALPNMPDIAEQSLAGALGTATHGTGAELGAMPAYVEELTLMTADGSEISCSRHNNADLFQAARVNLGALGFITAVRLQNKPAYRLEKTLDWRPIEDILAESEQLADRHRNFEFFYIPFSGWGFVDMQDLTEAEPTATETTDQNEGLYTLQRIRDWLSWSPRLREFSMGLYMRTLPTEYSVAPSWETYTHTRAVRWNEMEYHLPREDGLKAFREIRTLIEEQFPEVFFPIEVRYIKQDDIWLSPFFEQDSISIAVHRYYAEDHRPLFEAIEPIFRRYGGRPHWGKLHSLKGDELAALYPHWNDFLDVRQQLDPKGRFLNSYLRELFDLKEA